MNRHACLATALAAMLLVGSSLAGAQPSQPASSAESAQSADALIGRLSDSELKYLILRCSRVAALRRLGADEIAVCSMGYDILLSRTFKGDYLELSEWLAREERAMNEAEQHLSAI